MLAVTIVVVVVVGGTYKCLFHNPQAQLYRCYAGSSLIILQKEKIRYTKKREGRREEDGGRGRGRREGVVDKGRIWMTPSSLC